MKRVKIKFTGFRNSIHILPEDKAEKLLKKIYKEKANYLKHSQHINDDCYLKVELFLIKITPP